jgi:predicted GIY-YIG superfamily endonuclease
MKCLWAICIEMDGDMTIYVLKLQSDKYYVGRSKKLDDRIEKHKCGEGSKWTSLYPMIEVVETFSGDEYAEDATTKKYMKLYGINNVRAHTCAKC